jgi:hypothetical protein
LIPFAIITPSRGDRKPLLDFMRSRVPTSYEHIVVDYKPTSEAIDLVPRVKKGIEIARAKGFEYVVIAEDDDFYPEFYFDDIDFTDCDFFGYSTTLYYNLKNRTYQTLEHPGRASLFCTGFKIAALEKFIWPPDHWKFLDIRLWEYASNGDFRIKLYEDNPSVGIKGHGYGVHAGKGHTMRNKYQDDDLQHLKEFVDEEAFEFYKTLMGRL